MKRPLKHAIIPGVVGLFLFSACSKSLLVTPDIPDSSTKTPVTSSEVKAQSTTPVGTVIYTSNGYTLTLTNNDATFDDAERQRLVNTFFTVYPKLLNRFYTGATKKVKFVIDPTYNGVAYTSGAVTTLSAAWFHNHPEDIDVVTHEVMHIVQAYTGGAPGWLTEGIADYARYKYGVNNGPAGWSLPAWNASQNYTDAYRVTARFLVWLELHVRSSIVNDLNTALRTKTYTGSTWSQLTGKSVDQLWADYSQNPAL
ncbi:MAG TPA: basic secretory protein-like protein [Chitinophaga sp.]|uniref:basic secretory protein-like protein n=1 Tax=Chitinophaga sp. TaxID=1869181 RepID=UPI002DBA1460|nr:basic secretory protein-like protein [Chitinophaga sp.]HEU4554045.1 basic secretory protein-like protein [Chitinophaga sp.]